MKLTVKEIGYLKKFYPSPTEVSLMSNVKASLNGTEELSLMEKGILINGELRPEAKKILDLVAQAEVCTRLLVKTEFYIIEKYVYKVGEKMALVENANGELEISLPVDYNRIREELGEIIGTSNLKRADFQAVLKFDELMVFLALVDHERKTALKTYLEGGFNDEGLTEAIIAADLSKPGPNSLVAMMITNYGLPQVSGEKLKQALDQLEKINWIVKDKGYRLAQEQKIFAQGMLIPEVITMTEVIGTGSDGELATASGLFISAGMKDILALTFGKQEVDVETLTSAQQIQLLENYMHCPEVSKT